MVRAWLQRLAAAAPSRCAVCGAWPAEPICATCVARFRQVRPRCSRCAAGVPQGVGVCGACLRKPPPLDACLAAVPYAYPWSELVWLFKFRDQPGWATTLASLMAGTPGVPAALAEADTLVPMPLTSERLAERGFNQALELARRLAPPSRVDAGLLLRVRGTAPQASLPRSERQANVAGAFAVDPLRAGEVQGRRYLLVDDVMTSGASLHAAARALRAAGAAEVSALVLARTEETDGA